MNTYLKLAIPLLIVAAAATWYYTRDYPITAQPMAQTTEPLPPAQAPAPKYPLAGQGSTASLPALDDSDDSVKTTLQKLFGSADLSSVLIPTQIIRHIVVTVDNLPREKLKVSLRPLRATPGHFAVADQEDNTTLSTDNFDRYASVMALVQLADVEQCANWYRQHYLLFQQAYQNLGYPDGHFNDRLVQAIDDLLETPELTAAPIRLIRPKVFYEFADPELESRSVGQKTLIRMGPSNIKILKEKLKQLRAEIVKSGD